MHRALFHLHITVSSAPIPPSNMSRIAANTILTLSGAPGTFSKSLCASSTITGPIPMSPRTSFNTSRKLSKTFSPLTKTHRTSFSGCTRASNTPRMFLSSNNGSAIVRTNSTISHDQQKTLEPSLDEAKPLSSMPGPGGLKRIPYIGTRFLFKPFSPFTLETFGLMACTMHDRYGHVFRTRLGKDYAVHTCNIKDIENIFRTEPKYPRRRLMNLSKVYRERCGLPQGLGSCNGEEWYTLRKPLNVELKRPKVVQSYIPALNKVGEDFVERLLLVKGDSEDERAEEMFKLFFKFSSEGIGVACFNQRLGFLSSDLDNCPEKMKLLEAFRTSVKCTFRAIMGLERRYMKTENDEFYQTYYKAMSFIRQQSLISVNKVLDGVSDEDGSVTAPADSNLLRTLVNRKDLNREQVLSIIDSLLIAGTDSTARILTVLLYDMALNPDIQARVANDVRSFAGPDGPVTSECIDQVRILRACVKESMRLHFPVSSGVERILTRDMVISGYRVPSGTSVFMTGVKTSKDPAHFSNPTQFLPDRWLRTDLSRKDPDFEADENNRGIGNQGNRTLDSSSAASNSAFAFIPFGHGVRSCIGSRFAEMELMVGLAKVVQMLDVSVHPSYGPLDVCYTPFITPIRPVPFVFTRR